MVTAYSDYKMVTQYPSGLNGNEKHTKHIAHSLLICSLQFIVHSSDYEWKNKLRYVRIFFDTPTFDRITKGRAAKFVDMLSAVGGTMGLLTGFSIISGVEILYHVAQNTYLAFYKKIA